MVRAIGQASRPDNVVEAKLLTDYDAYYRDRTRQLPLPVLLVRVHDAQRSAYYIDPVSARIVASFNSHSRWNRWLYHGLHSIDLPQLYKHRLAWDFLVAALLLGGASLCVTSVLLAFGVLRRI